MKRLRKNSGFTLVECVVAMAVLAVMMLGLLMIMNITVRQRNLNTTMEQEVDSQVEGLVQGDTSTQTVANGVIDFGDGIQIIGGQMVYVDDSDSDVQIGALQYDVGSSPGSGNPANPGKPGNPAPDLNDILGQAYNYEYFKIYGAADVTGKVHITENKSGSGVYTVTWYVDFKTNSGNQEKAVKVVLPEGSYDVRYPNYSNCLMADMAYSTVRIQPAVVYNEWSQQVKYDNLATPLVSTATITFKISEADYKEYDCLAYYFTGNGKGSNANDVNVDLNT